jgi:hypothetical protein
MVVWSLPTYSLTMNGPVPTGWVWTWSPISFTAFGETKLSVPAPA